ncbi:MAG: iron ABC transporter substrate-binding protein [Actinomycetia bacterium]|nr:iron ABC transporter substrate-binding protein [Actinomycetes bacterium]
MASRRATLPLRTTALVALMAATALAAAACGGDEESGTEGDITLYTGRNTSLIEPLIEQFTLDTGIEVDVRPGGSSELASQILTEGDASPADVFLSQDAGALGAVAKAGLLADLPAAVVQAVPEAYRAADGTWVGTSGRARTIIYNPELVPDPPTGIDGLLDPAYAGTIGFAPANASFQAFVTGLRLVRGEDGAREWLEAFAAQEPVAFENNIAVRDAVDAGEVSLGLVNHYYLYELIDEVGEQNVTARNQFIGGGDPGGLVNVAGVGVLASSESSEDANAFVEYLVGPQGQNYFATATFEYPLASGVVSSAELPALETLEPPIVDLADLDSLAQTQELLAETGLLTK